MFAPLSEAYRKMGLLEEAKRICRFGTEAHPDFAGGHVAYAKALLDSKAPLEALAHLEKATRLSPDNLLAHNLLGETLIQLRRPKDALKAFKMVLYLDPRNERAQQAVKKWEFLTADEYSDDVFAMKPVFQVPLSARNDRTGANFSDHIGGQLGDQLDDELQDLLTESGSNKSLGEKSDSRLDLQQRHARALERAVSLADAFTVRNDLDAALKVLEDARRLLGPMSDIERRHKLITKRQEVYASEGDPEGDFGSDSGGPDENPALAAEARPALEFDPPTLTRDRKREILETLLRRINNRRTPSVG